MILHKLLKVLGGVWVIWLDNLLIHCNTKAFTRLLPEIITNQGKSQNDEDGSEKVYNIIIDISIQLLGIPGGATFWTILLNHN